MSTNLFVTLGEQHTPEVAIALGSLYRCCRFVMWNSLIYPMTAHVALTAILYVALTVARAPSIWGLGRRPDGTNTWAKVEPRISANLSNQFEWPVLFYVACVLLMQSPLVESVQLWLAWTFIAGRIVHSGVQVFTANVRLRGVVFTVNFAAVLAMWAILLLAHLQGALG